MCCPPGKGLGANTLRILSMCQQRWLETGRMKMLEIDMKMMKRWNTDIRQSLKIILFEIGIFYSYFYLHQVNHALFLLSIYFGTTNSSLSMEHGLFQLIKKLFRSKQTLNFAHFCLWTGPVTTSGLKEVSMREEVGCSVFCSKIEDTSTWSLPSTLTMNLWAASTP